MDSDAHWLRLACCVPLIGLLISAGNGCAISKTASLASEYPLDRARAAVACAEAGDPTAVHKLVDLLEDEDRGVRMYASLALERLTGSTYGFKYYAPRVERELAVDRWRDALRNGQVTVRRNRAPTGKREPEPDGSSAGDPAGTLRPKTTEASA